MNIDKYRIDICQLGVSKADVLHGLFLPILGVYCIKNKGQKELSSFCNGLESLKDNDDFLMPERDMIEIPNCCVGFVNIDKVYEQSLTQTIAYMKKTLELSTHKPQLNIYVDWFAKIKKPLLKFFEKRTERTKNIYKFPELIQEMWDLMSQFDKIDVVKASPVMSERKKRLLYEYQLLIDMTYEYALVNKSLSKEDSDRYFQYRLASAQGCYMADENGNPIHCELSIN